MWNTHNIISNFLYEKINSDVFENNEFAMYNKQ